MSELLSRMHITDMAFHKRDTHPDQRISLSHRSMCECARVDDDPVDVSLAIALGAKAGGCVNAVDDGAFVVGLEGL